MPYDVTSWLPKLLGPVNISDSLQPGAIYLIAYDANLGEYKAISVPTIDGDVVSTDAAQTLTNKRIDDALLGYSGMPEPGAHPYGSSGVGPRVINASFFDEGTPITSGFAMQQMMAAYTATTTQTAIASVVLAEDEGVAIDALITCRSGNSSFGRYKLSVCYQRIGNAAPTIVGAAESGTPQGAGGTIAVGVTGNNVLIKTTPVDANNRIWLTQMHMQRMPAVP